jgi:tellurite resistance-related uncharacterized protein
MQTMVSVLRGKHTDIKSMPFWEKNLACGALFLKFYTKPSDFLRKNVLMEENISPAVHFCSKSILYKTYCSETKS